MRGVAVILASTATWIVVTKRLPQLKVRLTIAPIAVGLGAVVAGGVGLLAYGFLGSLVPALAIALLSASIPMVVAGARSRTGLRQQMELWPDTLAYTRASIAAGQTLPDALSDAIRRVGGVLGSFENELRRQITFGDGFGAALIEMRSQLDDPVTDRVVATLIVAQRSGGHRVGEVLHALQQSVADDLRLRSAHDAALTEQRWTAGVALVAPWALLVLSIATNPSAAHAYDTVEGATVVIIGFVATLAGWFLAARSARLSQPPRLFR